MANYNVDIEVGLKGLQKLGQFQKSLKAIEETYVGIEQLNKRAANQKLTDFYKASRETLIKLAGDQMKLDSMLKQGAEIRAGYAKDRKAREQKIAEAEQKAIAHRIASEKEAAIAAKNANIQRLNDQRKISKLFEQAERIREGFADARAADVKLEIDLQDERCAQRGPAFVDDGLKAPLICGIHDHLMEGLGALPADLDVVGDALLVDE